MAVTATARMAGGGPSWDEEVVPALRKRLEGESRVLTKRISAAVSISDLDEASGRPSFSQQVQTQQQQRTSADRPRPERAATAAPKSSTNAKSSAPNGTTAGKQRTRTYSTPKLSEIPANRTTPKPTRIPKAAPPRGRTASISGNVNGYTATTNGGNTTDGNGVLAAAAAKLAKQPSQDTIHIPARVRQTPGLLNEPAPFPPSSGFTSPAGSQDQHWTSHGNGQYNYDSNGGYSNAQYYDNNANSNGQDGAEYDDTPPRPSTESTERPFEHWYRGEVSRNGGVGEIKLGKRAEMLEIANYGHTLKQKQALREAELANPTTPSRMGRREGDGGWGVDGEGGGRGRKRSESVAGIEARRESLYLEDDYAHERYIRDEGPLTDLDADVDADGDAEMSDGDYYHHHAASTMAATPTATPRQTRIPGPSPGRITPTAGRITPTPTGAGRTTPTPTPMHRGASEPPSFPASSSSSTPAQPARQPANAKRAATASPPPASSSSSSNKRARQAAATVSPKSAPKARAQTKRSVSAQQQAWDRERDRSSVAYYPSPGDDGEEGDMADAIPSWTQPVAPATGRWDDVSLASGWLASFLVVLPVVARKKGLEEMYTKADGSPKPRKEEGAVAPAPGTFGWDHSKYRPPRDGDDIQMDEFGQPLPDSDPDRTMNDEELAAFGQRPRYPPTEHEQQPVGPQAQSQRGQEQKPEPPRSPMPFSGYQPQSGGQAGGPGEGVIDLEAAKAKFGAQRVEEEEDGGAGCCKCVVM
ncbi:hypothetical protein C8F04DRAFT_1393429 [Mycena alexandri]|uniref:Uncharacterized protein n=1 Tax=Mycena alexandri TaxID=1745969 RepID=A0AAD6T2S3_9AGAR|nr:hypothetical protein C8F04DRAFT_1393429 [Mycena alexandri]